MCSKAPNAQHSDIEHPTTQSDQGYPLGICWKEENHPIQCGYVYQLREPTAATFSAVFVQMAPVCVAVTKPCALKTSVCVAEFCTLGFAGLDSVRGAAHVPTTLFFAGGGSNSTYVNRAPSFCM